MAKAEDAAPGFWGNVDPKTKRWLIIGASVVIVGGTSYYFTRKAIRKSRANKVLKSAIHDGTLASLVEKFNEAIDGAGTDEQKVYESFSDIPTQKAADRFAVLYQAAYDESLEDALRGDLGTDERQTVNNIIAGKPKTQMDKPNYDLLDDWITRLTAAAGYWSTDEDSIYRVLWEVPDKKGYTVLSSAIATKKVYGYSSLTDYLTGQLDDGEQEQARYIMARKK